MAEAAAPPTNRPLAGVAWMVLTGVEFVMVAALVKHVGGRIPPAEVAFIRYAFALVFLAPAIGALRATTFGPRRLGVFVARGAAHGIGVILWFYAMTKIPLAEVTALNYLSPIYVTLGAAAFLGERLAARRLIAVAVALGGAFVILRPGLRELSGGHLAMLGTAALFGASYLMAKRLSDTVTPVVVVAMLSFVVTAMLAPVAALVWVTPRPAEIGWLALVAGFATAGHTTMTIAFRAAPLSVTQPVVFLQLVWASILGAAVFGEPIDPWVMVGGGLIIAAVSFIAWREAMLRRRPTTAAGPGG